MYKRQQLIYVIIFISMVVSNGTLNQSISLGKPTNIAKYDEIVRLKDKFIERLGDSHDRSLRGKKEKW